MKEKQRFRRVALFLDYENLILGLKKRSGSSSGPYGVEPRIDFPALVQFICEHFGPLAREDFIAVANFSHFDAQKGGLNQAATLVPVDSFDARKTRQIEQSSPGKKYVVQNFADMRLAFELGKHAAETNADLYILVTGDKAFAAPAQALLQAQRRVLFLPPVIETAAILIKDNFPCLDFMATQPDFSALEQPDESSTNVPGDEVEIFCRAVSSLRQEFCTAIPRCLLEAVFGVNETAQLFNKAHGLGKMDEWNDPNGIVCFSLREERLSGKIQPHPVRVDFAHTAKILYHTSQISITAPPNADISFWNHALKNQAALSVSQAKAAVQRLLQVDILRHGRLQKADISLEKAVRFLHAGEAGQKPEKT